MPEDRSWLWDHLREEAAALSESNIRAHEPEDLFTPDEILIGEADEVEKRYHTLAMIYIEAARDARDRGDRECFNLSRLRADLTYKVFTFHLVERLELVKNEDFKDFGIRKGWKLVLPPEEKKKPSKKSSKPAMPSIPKGAPVM